jgi:ribosomal protein L30/L7E
LTIDVALVTVRSPMDRMRWMRRVCKLLNMRQMGQMREMG